MADSEDIRVHMDWPTHPKTMRLARLGNAQACLCLIFLWCWVRKHRPDGDLGGLDALELEAAAMVPATEEPGRFVANLVDSGFLRQNDTDFILHDWNRWQSWSMGAESRSEKSARAAQIRYLKRDGLWSDDMKEWSTDMLRECRGHARGNATGSNLAMPKRANAHAPAPPPTPAPKGRGVGGGETLLAATSHPPTGIDPEAWASWTVEQREDKLLQIAETRAKKAARTVVSDD